MMKSNDFDDLNVAISATVTSTFGSFKRNVVRHHQLLVFVNHHWSVIK